MSELEFFKPALPATLASLGGDARWPNDADPTQTFEAAAPLGRAGPRDVTVFLDSDDPDDLAASRAGACFVADRHLALVPDRTIALVSDTPEDAFCRALSILYPASAANGPVFERSGIDPAAIVHGDAVFERNVTVDPGVIIGPRVEVGAGTTIGVNAVIGAGVRIGRDCIVDPQVSIRAALIGDRVTIHAGARIGLDPKRGPSLGRVIVQDDVEIGANAVIERGQLGDTMIGARSRVRALDMIGADTLVEREAGRSRGIEVWDARSAVAVGDHVEKKEGPAT